MKKIQCCFVLFFIICMSWQAVFAQEQGSPLEWFNKGMALKNNGVYEEAINMFTKAIELDKNYVDAYLQRGHAYWVSDTSRYRESMADFDKAILVAPTNAEAYYQRGLLNAFLLNNEDARTDMEAAAGLGHKGAKHWLFGSSQKAKAALVTEMKEEADSEMKTIAAKEKRADLRECLPSKTEPMIYFDFDKSNIKKEFHAILDEVGSVLKDQLTDMKIIVAGHTDNMGEERYNDKLSLSRADAVKSYLESLHGISPERIIIKGYGLSNPIDTNETEEGRAKNRRAHIQIQ